MREQQVHDSGIEAPIRPAIYGEPLLGDAAFLEPEQALQLFCLQLLSQFEINPFWQAGTVKAECLKAIMTEDGPFNAHGSSPSIRLNRYHSMSGWQTAGFARPSALKVSTTAFSSNGFTKTGRSGHRNHHSVETPRARYPPKCTGLNLTCPHCTTSHLKTMAQS